MLAVLEMPRPKATPDTFNLRLDAELKAKGLAWADLLGSNLSTEFKRWLTAQVRDYEKEHGPIKLD